MNTTKKQPVNPFGWGKIFPASDKVECKKVTFKNRYGITLVGDLYIPKDREADKLPALAVCGGFGAVKEQASGFYAQTMAERGFVTLAFDPSYTGESGGEPRNVASPDINTEDFSAAVDCLGLQRLVDRERIGIIGICGWGGFALNAAAIDTRIKEVATMVMYDMSRIFSKGYFDSDTPEKRLEMKRSINALRWVDAETGTPSGGQALPDTAPEGIPQFLKDYIEFYKTPRGWYGRSVSEHVWTATTLLSFMNFPLLSYADEINIPVLMITGENAHSRYMSEDAFKAIGSESKELVIIPNARHIDFYDNQAGVIPFDKLEDFFRGNLR
ncbi:alpha/beta hydrolase [Porphyromonas sp.]|uniref:alpha/beta hydrolase n=1 Tax=Porphyromonas sp. TaxID=1924944 RepID=UPI0026DB383A|nr:alpha/beta hydrolase [Porphyromonas sp.]MDO4770937.1 alpha/beta hydrolase [Porphyromonas sp.]